MQKPPGIACLDGLSMSTALRTESRALSEDFGLHVNLLARVPARARVVDEWPPLTATKFERVNRWTVSVRDVNYNHAGGFRGGERRGGVADVPS